MNFPLLLILLGGFLLRLLTARGTILNPDETIVFLVANQPDLKAVYQASLTQPHPPLAVFLLYFWRHLGTSELFLRLFSVVSGTGAVYFFYRFLKLKFDRFTALSGTILFAFLPPVVALSAEVRQYALLLLVGALALFFLEKGFSSSRPWDLLLAGVFSGLAGATQYTGLLLSLTLGVLFLYQAVKKGLKRPLFVAGITGQVFAFGLYIFFYFTHIVRLKGSPMQLFALTGWLRSAYFHPEIEPFLSFLFRATSELFTYLLGGKLFGLIGLLLFLLGVGYSIVKRRLVLTLLVLFPFLSGVLGAVFHLIPYGGTRHSIILAPFFVLGITTTLSFIPKINWLRPGFAGILALTTNIFLTPPAQHIHRQDARPKLMNRAIQFLKENAPPGDTIFADYQSSVLLSYYLADHTRPVPFFGHSHGPFWEFSYGDYLVVTSTEWSLNRAQFLTFAESLFHYYPFSDNRTVWVFDGGWGRPLVLNEAEWGRNLAVFSITAPSTAIENIICAAGEKVRPLLKNPVRSVFLPTRYFKKRLVTATAPLAQEVISYSELYRRAREKPDEFDSTLPALAFWVFGDAEWHAEFMGYMADGESYISAGYRFTLILLSPFREVAVYRVEKIEQ
ncbi:MAG: glycosyltransferase family 39 protein [bacterium]